MSLKTSVHLSLLKEATSKGNINHLLLEVSSSVLFSANLHEASGGDRVYGSAGWLSIRGDQSQFRRYIYMLLFCANFYYIFIWPKDTYGTRLLRLAANRRLNGGVGSTARTGGSSLADYSANNKIS